MDRLSSTKNYTFPNQRPKYSIHPHRTVSGFSQRRNGEKPALWGPPSDIAGYFGGHNARKQDRYNHTL